MIYVCIFLTYSIFLMAFILLSYVVWLFRSFSENPVGFVVTFSHMGYKRLGRVMAQTPLEYLLKCDTGVRFRYVAKELCKPSLFGNLPG